MWWLELKVHLLNKKPMQKHLTYEFSLPATIMRTTWFRTLYSHACIYSFIHSGHFYSAPSSPLLLRGAPDHSTDTVSGFHAEAPQATVSKGLAQGSYVAARAGVEPTTLRLRVIDLINAPPRLIMHTCIQYNYILTLLTTVSLYLL